MSHKDELRVQRNGTVINRISLKQERLLRNAVQRVARTLTGRFPGITLAWEPSLRLVDVVSMLKGVYPHVSFATPMETSAMRPDGGFLYIVSNDGKKCPVLITEKKNQGTNDLRAEEGKQKQAMGNAIERLGKNVIGLRTALLPESIFPFICFGDGCDFADGSSILDRVITIAMFGELNVEHLHNDPPFNRGTFYFREQPWNEEEMYEYSVKVAISSVYYYYSRYGEESFI